MPHIFKNLPLRQKLFLPMAISLALILTAASIYYPHRQRMALTEAYRDAAEKTLELFSVAIANALDQHNFVLLQRTLRGAQVDKNIQLLLLYDNEGELISLYDPNGLIPGETDGETFDFSQLGDRMILLDKNIFGIEEQKLARLILGYSLEQLRAQVLEYRIVTFLIAFLAFSIGLLLIDRVSHGVTAVLGRLHDQMEEIIQRKNFGNKIEVTTADEIGRLAEVFNEMIEELQK
ncbi:MAG: HAMP domain-containing protein, partial [Calditrichaeota bacterium]